jgi:hypothetical protein
MGSTLDTSRRSAPFRVNAILIFKLRKREKRKRIKEKRERE